MQPSSVLEQCRRPDGSTDWNKVAKLSHYAVSVEILHPASEVALTTVVEQGILQDKLPETVAVNTT
ncbi:MAG: hypothetical protein JWO41_689 [Candidatus Saccharibacteria bacterium]|nr:hypothetical protein [Candidatus Saccharibacteria bacterium]